MSEIRRRGASEPGSGHRFTGFLKTAVLKRCLTSRDNERRYRGPRHILLPNVFVTREIVTFSHRCTRKISVSIRPRRISYERTVSPVVVTVRSRQIHYARAGNILFIREKLRRDRSFAEHPGTVWDNRREKNVFQAACARHVRNVVYINTFFFTASLS